MTTFTKYLIVISFFVFPASSWAAEPIQFELQGDKLEIPTDGRTWNEAVRNEGATKGSVEYVLPDEKVDNWSELVTINYFLGLEGEDLITRFISFTKDGLYKQCADVKWEELEKKQDSVVYTWTAQNCKGWSDQTEVARAVKSAQGLYVLHYASKKVPMPADKRAVWVKLFTKATIKSSS